VPHQRVGSAECVARSMRASLEDRLMLAAVRGFCRRSALGALLVGLGSWHSGIMLAAKG
jgi:hypothetical protein